MTENNIVGRTEEMDPFLLKALQEPRDRFLVLQLDKQLEKFMKSTQTQLQFPSMNGYQRMIVHKVAHYFGMMHTVDRDKKSVTVFKQKDSAIPMLRFTDLTEPQEDKLKKVVLLKRPAQKQESSKEQREDLDDGNKEDDVVEDREEKPSNVVNDQIIQSIQKMKISNSSDNRVTNKLSGSTELRMSKKEVEPFNIVAPSSPIVVKSKTHLTTVPTILTKVSPGSIQAEVSVLRKSNKTASPPISQKTMEEREEEYLKARARIFADIDKSDVLEWSPEMDNPIGNDSDEDKLQLEQVTDYLDSDQDYKRPLEPISYPSGKQMFSTLNNDIYNTSFENPWMPYENYHGNTVQLPTNNRGMIYGNKFGAPINNASPYQTMISCPPNSSEYLPSHTRNPTQMVHDTQPIHYTNHFMGMDNYRNPISNLNSRISDTNVWPYSIPNNTIHPQLSPQIKNPQSEVLPCIVPNTFSTLSSNDPILPHPKAKERSGASHIYQGRINPNQSNFGYYPNIGYPYIWKQENELEYDDIQKRDFIHGVFSNSDYIEPSNSIYPTEDLNQRMPIPGYHGGYQHISDTNFEERRTKTVNPNHPTLNLAPIMPLYGPPKQSRILEPFSQEQPNNYSPSLYIPGFYPNKLIVNPSNEMSWASQSNLNNAMPSEDKSKLIMQTSQKQQPKKQKPSKQKQKQKQKQKKVQEPPSNVSPTFLLTENLSLSNPYWEESDILSELSGEKKFISSLSDGTQEQPQQPNHILEIISSPQSRNHVILQIKKHGGIIKDLKTTTIAIFKNKEVAKEVYQYLKGNDFYLKPFTLQMSTGFESFSSNKNPKIPSSTAPDKEPIQPLRLVQIPQQPVIIQPKRTTMTTTITTTTTTTITTDFEVPQHSLPVNVKDTQPEDHVDQKSSVNNTLKK